MNVSVSVLAHHVLKEEVAEWLACKSMVLASCLCVVEELVDVAASAWYHKWYASHLSVLNHAFEHACWYVLRKPATWQWRERYVVSDMLHSADGYLLQVVPITAFKHSEPVCVLVCVHHGSVLHHLVSVRSVSVVGWVEFREVSVLRHQYGANLREPNLSHEAAASCLAVCRALACCGVLLDVECVLVQELLLVLLHHGSEVVECDALKRSPCHHEDVI